MAFINIRMYKKIPINALNTFFIFGILSIIQTSTRAVAYTSLLTTFITLWLIILYHLYAYTKIYSKVKKNRMINRFKVIRVRHNLRQLPDGRFKELLDKITGPANSEDHDVPFLINSLL